MDTQSRWGLGALWLALGRAAATCSVLVSLSTAAATYNASLDTSALAGTAAQLAFDFIDGGSPANTVIVSAFATDGVLGLDSAVGGVSGHFPGAVTLTDTGFFNEYLAGLSLGNSLSFSFAVTGNGPGPGSVPDAFSVFLLDPVSGISIVSTTDPTGANSLFRFDIDGGPAGVLNVFSPNATVALTTPVPEPGSFTLLGLGLLAMLALRKPNPHLARIQGDGSRSGE